MSGARMSPASTAPVGITAPVKSSRVMQKVVSRDNPDRRARCIVLLGFCIE